VSRKRAPEQRPDRGDQRSAPTRQLQSPSRRRTSSKAEEPEVRQPASAADQGGAAPAGRKRRSGVPLVLITVAALAGGYLASVRLMPETMSRLSAAVLGGPLGDARGEGERGSPLGAEPVVAAGADEAGDAPEHPDRIAADATKDAEAESEASVVAATAGAEKPRRRKVEKGKLTLVTLPECTVMRGKTVVGKTPLFSVELPAGTHLLRLRGPDGRVRLLSTPIERGKTTAFRIQLSDLPFE
jgi:hypothetical protein